MTMRARSAAWRAVRVAGWGAPREPVGERAMPNPRRVWPPGFRRGRGLAGISLVELLVAMLLGVLLLLGVVQVLSGSRATYRLNEAQTRLQEAGRFASQTLARDLRMARSAGCSSVAAELAGPDARLNVLACPLLGGADCSGAPVIGTSQALGYTASQRGGAAWLKYLSPAAQTSVGARWLTGDVLVTWGVWGSGLFAGRNTLTAAMTESISLVGTAAALTSAGLTGGHLALITDCEGTDIFAITNPTDADNAPRALQHGTSFSANADAEAPPDANIRTALQRAYNLAGAETYGPSIRARVYPFDMRVFFICCVDQDDGGVQSTTGTVDYCNPAADGYAPDRYRPALCRWSASDRATRSLVLDVADLRATYDGSLDLPSTRCRRNKDNTHNRLMDWVGANETADAAWIQSYDCWDRVDTVRVELLFVSPEDISTGPVRQFNTTGAGLGAYLPADRRLYESVRFNVVTRSTNRW